MAASSSVGAVPAIWAAAVDPADVPMTRSASVTSSPPSNSPAITPISHALPVDPPPPRTKARLPVTFLTAPAANESAVPPLSFTTSGYPPTQPRRIKAAIDHHARAGDVCTRLRREERDQAGDLLGASQATERHLGPGFLHRLRTLAREPFGVDVPGHDAYRADPVPAPLDGEAGREVLECGSGRRRVDVPVDPSSG